MSRQGGRPLYPLGSFAPVGRESWSPRLLERTAGLPPDTRSKVIDYLSGCPVFLAWMEHTRDEIGGRFGVEGGSAIASDGTFYWRLDAIEYIREYGIPVPLSALEHFAARGWAPPLIDRHDFMEIYEALDRRLGGGEVVG